MSTPLLPQSALSKDFVLSPVQGVLDQRIPRVLEFGKRSALSMGLDDGIDEKLDRAVTKPLDQHVEPQGATLFDFFAMMLVSHLVGTLAHSPMLGHTVDAGLELRNMAEGAGHAAERTAGMSAVLAIDPAAQMDPNLVFMPNGKAMPIPSLAQLGTKVDAAEEQRKRNALAAPSGARSVVRFGKRGSAWA